MQKCTRIRWRNAMFQKRRFRIVQSDSLHLPVLSLLCAWQWCQVILEKQACLKNKPKIGNLTEKQAQHALAWKFNKTKNQQENWIKKQWNKSEKTSTKSVNFHKNTPNMPLAVNWNSKSAIKFEKKAMRKTEICKTQAQKTCKFQLKQAQKQTTRKHKP